MKKYTPLDSEIKKEKIKELFKIIRTIKDDNVALALIEIVKILFSSPS